MLSITSEYQDQVFAKYHKTSILDFSSISSGFAGVLTRQNDKEDTINQSDGQALSLLMVNMSRLEERRRQS